MTGGRRPVSPHRLRLELNPAGTGDADGVWWPHSRDLAAELTDLLAALRPGFGPIRCVHYHVDEWSNAPREMDSGGHPLRLEGYRHMPARTLDILGAAPDATLTLRLITPVADADMVAAQPRWDSEREAGAYAGAWLRARHRAAERANERSDSDRRVR
ncbi:DUF5994 family protein [Nocardia wallacei]|uniref:DUF5994 family protein n=1 Tax=Nocardia wallacei TaxID=480035 RepID=UPI0024545D5D|nr:DUF5994 family protein [Nocardia wallacei]